MPTNDETTEHAWSRRLGEQLRFYWDVHLWPRLQGLTDDEYLWEPVEGGWSVRASGAGEYALEQFSPEPPIPPVTTIAWRLVHIGRDILGKRARALFGPTPAPPDATMYDDRHWPEPLPITAADALGFLDQTYALWRDGVAALDDEAMNRPLGPKGDAFAEEPMADLVLHVNREVMAHGAEICLLRDLYRAYRDREDPVVAACLAGRADEAARLLDADPTTAERLRRERPSLPAEVAGLRRWEAVRILTDRGFDPSPDPPGPLHFAAAAGALDEVRFLVERGADTEAVDAQYGYPPAGWADYFGHAEVADYLRSVTR